MKTIEHYLRLPYRLEIVPDPDEGGMQHAILSFPDASRAETRWMKLCRMLSMLNVYGLRQQWKMV
ncbi:MAG: hypothetical protein ACI361_03090 [Atopobiaceae bacterium]